MRIPVVWSGNRQSGGGSQSSGETQQASQNSVPRRIGRTRVATDCPLPPWVTGRWGAPDGGHTAFDASPPTRGRFPLRNQRGGHRSQETWVVLIFPQKYPATIAAPKNRCHPSTGKTKRCHPSIDACWVGGTFKCCSVISGAIHPLHHFGDPNSATHPYLNGATHRTACSARLVPSTQFEHSNGATHRTACSARLVPTTQFELSNGATHSLPHVGWVAPLDAANVQRGGSLRLGIVRSPKKIILL